MVSSVSALLKIQIALRRTPARYSEINANCVRLVSVVAVLFGADQNTVLGCLACQSSALAAGFRCFPMCFGEA